MTAGVRQLLDPGRTAVLKFDELGLVVVRTDEPTHYYSLFGLTKGYDVVHPRPLVLAVAALCGRNIVQ